MVEGLGFRLISGGHFTSYVTYLACKQPSLLLYDAPHIIEALSTYPPPPRVGTPVFEVVLGFIKVAWRLGRASGYVFVCLCIVVSSIFACEYAYCYHCCYSFIVVAIVAIIVVVVIMFCICFSEFVGLGNRCHGSCSRV